MLVPIYRGFSGRHILGVFLFFLLLWVLYSRLLFPPKLTLEMAREKSGPRKVQVEVYYETLCPDSRYFVLHQFYPAWEKVSDIMDVHWKPYGKATHKYDGEKHSFFCQHGPAECMGNMVHACAIKHIKDQHKLAEYVKCMIYDNYEPKSAGKKCAGKLDVNWSKIQECTDGKEGGELLAMHGDDTHSMRPKLSFVPTILLDGSHEQQKDILKNFRLELCRKYKGVHPPNCLEIL